MTRVMKEKIPGLYTSDDGWKIITLKMEKWTDQRNQLINPEGVVVDTSYFAFGFEREHDLKIYHYVNRTGRTGETEKDLKFNTLHFPRGTVVEIDDTVGYRQNRSDYTTPKLTRFTVDHLVCIGPRSYVAVMQECRPMEEGSPFSGEPHEYNISWVRRIISRGTGPVVFSSGRKIDGSWVAHQEAAFGDIDLSQIRTKRGEQIVFYPDYLITLLAQTQGSIDRSLRDNALSILEKRGFLRLVAVVDPDEWRGFRGAWVVKVNLLKKWMAKNLHQLLVPLDVEEKERAREDKAMYDDLHDDVAMTDEEEPPAYEGTSYDDSNMSNLPGAFD